MDSQNAHDITDNRRKGFIKRTNPEQQTEIN